MIRIKQSRKLSFLLIICAYSLALITAAIVYRQLPDRMPLLLKTLMADGAATVVIFLFSLVLNNSSCYDAYWSVAPPIIVCFWIFSITGFQEHIYRSFAILTVTSLWAIRLTVNWALSWPGLSHEDWRLKSMRCKAGKFYWPLSLAGLHLFPTALVFFCLIPAFIAIRKGSTSFNVLDITAIAIALTAVYFEWRSDYELSIHRKTASKGKPITSGLWKYSRHPNYFGEILFWFSLWLFSLAASTAHFWIVIAPIVMLCQFVFISIPMMEKRQLDKDNGYGVVRKKVSMLIPMALKRSSES